jgi:hypothetical protein
MKRYASMPPAMDVPAVKIKKIKQSPTYNREEENERNRE